jgi:XTP/dITP diphosphohydrolase
MKHILLAGTRNPHKLREIRAILSSLPVEIIGAERLSDAEVEETGTTFAAIARDKALEYARRALALAPAERPRWVLADDSGLEVEALGGAPGVHSARWAGPGAGAGANNEKLLRALEGLGGERRRARFACALALAEVDGPFGGPRLLLEVEGACEGRIAAAPQGAGGFGYDPLFIPAGSSRTFAELEEGEKNRLSHRGRALERFRAAFQHLIEQQSLA